MVFTVRKISSRLLVGFNSELNRQDLNDFETYIKEVNNETTVLWFVDIEKQVDDSALWKAYVWDMEGRAIAIDTFHDTAHSYGYKKLKEMVVIHMNIRNLYKDIKRDMERNGKDKTLRNFTPTRKMTYEQMLGILHELKRDSMSMNWNGNFTEAIEIGKQKSQ